MESIISHLSWDKYKINSSSSILVSMDLFKSFLTIDLQKSTSHLGSDMGWTKYTNTEHKIIISGGHYKGGEWLDSVQYGIKLHNPYNNYCTPLYLAPIMTKEGVDFFKEYYKVEIDRLFMSIDSKILELKNQIIHNEKKALSWQKELKDLSS